MTQPKDGGVNAAAKFTAAVNNDLVCVGVCIFVTFISSVCAFCDSVLDFGGFLCYKVKRSRMKMWLMCGEP